MFRAPRPAHLPHITTMLDDIPASIAQIANYLGIKESTLKTYKRTGNAPHAVLLALFWETKWGMSLLDVNLFNEARMHQAHAIALNQQQKRLMGIIWRLENERENLQEIAANSPFYGT